MKNITNMSFCILFYVNGILINSNYTDLNKHPATKQIKNLINILQQLKV